jgi:spore maturation protein CgeB
MRLVCFYHSLLSDWNHGNAHFLRGVMSELCARGHEAIVYEPDAGWSLRNLLDDQGASALAAFATYYPGLRSERYKLEELDLDAVLAGADVVIVHEWSPHELVARVGQHRRRHPYLLLFHDTHHRMVTAPEEMSQYDLSHYDAVLAFGDVLRRLYLKRGLPQAFTWHEAADARVFRPLPAEPCAGAVDDLVWIGNWGDDERSEELREFLLEPCQKLSLSALVHGVRYPQHAQQALAAAGIRYGGFLPNYLAPQVFARHLMTVHVPRRPYVRALVGVPTIRVFEALACGIPLVSAPWHDEEALFRAGVDFLLARDGAEMVKHLRDLRHDAALRQSLREHGLQTVLNRHTCAHRVDELFTLLSKLGLHPSGQRAAGRKDERDHNVTLEAP